MWGDVRHLNPSRGLGSLETSFQSSWFLSLPQGHDVTLLRDGPVGREVALEQGLGRARDPTGTAAAPGRALDPLPSPSVTPAHNPSHGQPRLLSMHFNED